MSVQHSFTYDSLSNKLSQFALPKAHGNVMSIVKVENLSEDDQAVLIKSKIGVSYVLYSAHKIKNLDEVKEKAKKWQGEDIDKFMMPKRPVEFDQTLGARFYKSPDQKEIAKWMPYAIPSGHEYSFLLQIKVQ